MKIGPLAFAVALAAFLWWRRRRLGRVELGLGVLAVGALGVYATGVVHLPNLEHLIEDLGTALGSWTYLLVGVMAFLETGAFIGLVAPGETTILVGGVVAGQGKIDIVALIALVWACAVAGDVTSFLLGRRLGRGFMERHGPKVKITHERLEQVERFFARHGGKAILLGRFVGLVRAVAPFVAGSSKMPLRRFLPYDIVGAGLWGTAYCVLGYVFWSSFSTVAAYAGKGALALGTVIVVVVGAVTGYRWLREPGNRERARRWLDEQAERPALRPVARVVRPVVRRAVLPAARALSGPLRFAGDRLTPGELGLELTTLVAVLAVGSFGFFALALSVEPGDPSLFVDRRAASIAAGLRTGWLVDVAKVLTDLGALWVVAPVCLAAVVLLGAWRQWGAALVLAVATGLVVATVHAAKAIVDRPRPPHGLVHTLGASYPSGHSTYAIAWVAIAVLLWRFVPWLAGRAVLVTAAVAVALAIGATRVYLRAHYLSDVLGGWGLGASVYAICAIAALLVVHIGKNRAQR